MIRVAEFISNNVDFFNPLLISHVSTGVHPSPPGLLGLVVLLLSGEQ